MKPEPDTDVDPKSTHEWLDGLAGRGGDSKAARAGAALRDALNPAAADGADWAQVVAAADRPSAARLDQRPMHSANESSWRRVAGSALFALVIAIGFGMWSTSTRQPESGGELRGNPSARGATWKTQGADAAARDLADRLRKLGARVVVTTTKDGAQLDVDCDTASATRINQELQAIDVSLDAACHLSLQVIQAP